MTDRSPQMGDSQGLKATDPKEGGAGRVEVTPWDLARLYPGEYLNDTCIALGMKCAAAPTCFWGAVLTPVYLGRYTPCSPAHLQPAESL